jgi:hypothetical protein
MITYEKIIALLSDNKEHHVNIMSRIDFIGMIIGSIIGILLIDIGYQYLLLVPCVFYAINAAFFIFSHLRFDDKKTKYTSSNPITEQADNQVKLTSLRFIMSTPIILAVIGVAIGNNMFDGLVESSGTTLIDKAMALPVKYFGLIDIAAGVFGVVGTYIYSMLLTNISRSQLLSIGLLAIIMPSVILIANIHSIFVFISCYSLTIIGKVITGNTNRIIRIEIIPTEILASTSSIIVLLCQSILPVVGISLFLFGRENDFVTYLMIGAIFTSFISGIFMLRLNNKKQVENSILKIDQA